MGSKADYEKFFAEADTDNSGTLSMQELTAVLKKKGYRGGKAEIEGFFKSVDTSGDGKISKDEYMIAMGQQPPEVHNEAAMRSCFNCFDKDGSGEIDKSELRSVFAEMERYLSEAELKRMMELADLDGSGTMNYEEFIAMVFGR